MQLQIKTFLYRYLQHLIMQKKKKILFWSILFIIFLLLTVVFTVRAINRYELWKEHEVFLKSDNNTVEDWMTINLISKRSDIPIDVIYSEIGINESFSNSRKPLKKLCQDNNLNCTDVVAKLNRLVEYKHK